MNHQAVVIVSPGISWGLQILYYLTKFTTCVVGFRACSSVIPAMNNQQQSFLSIGINDLEESSNWTIKFVLTNKSVSPDMMVNRGFEFKNRFRKLPPQLLKIEQNTAKAYSEVSFHVWEG